MMKFFAFVAFVVVIVGLLNYFGYADVGFFSKDEFDRDRHCKDVTYLYNRLVEYYADQGRFPQNLEELTPEYMVNLREYLGHYSYSGGGTSFNIGFTDPDGSSYTITSVDELRAYCSG